ncbi:MAG: surface carbohydrate biosynthesis protein [Nitrospirota bacterium]
MKQKTVVILVDSKKRDLMGDVLIAHHLEETFGIRCELQPLESWRSCLSAFSPHYILFNHLTSSHLAEFSNRLKKMGILVGVLPNEGILYDREVLDYNAGKFHANAYMDHYFCWNSVHGEALVHHMKHLKDSIRVIGVPRFDYYFEPWKNLFAHPKDPELITKRPRILVCTNFGFAACKEMPRQVVDRLFQPWKDRISKYHNYWDIIEANARSRDRLFLHLVAILEKTDCFIDLKPHPRENPDIYVNWHRGLSPVQRARVKLWLSETLNEVLPFCDLEISCETCTTAIESWLLQKPTIELVFERNPVTFHEDVAKTNFLCDNPDVLPGLIVRTLKNPGQMEFQGLRKQHLAKWCSSPAGASSFRIAEIIADSLEKAPEPLWDFDFQDWRRGIKLRFKNSLDLAYGSNPWKLLLGYIYGTKKYPLEEKFIRPHDVKEWKNRLRGVSRKEV